MPLFEALDLKSGIERHTAGVKGALRQKPRRMLPTLAFEKAFSKAVGLTWLHDGVEVLMPTRLRLRYCRYGRSWLSQAAGLTLKIAWWLRLFVMLFRTYRISQNLGLKVAKTWMSLEPSRLRIPPTFS